MSPTKNGVKKHDDWKRPDTPMRCTFVPGMSLKESPHNHEACKPRMKLANTILDVIGHTPLVRLNRIPKEEDIKCEIFVKCEFMNPGGSIKDRIARRMIEEAEKMGKLKKGDLLIEPTSGNTGIGLALVSAVKGYRCMIAMPEKMSKEKEYLLQGLGAETIRTRTSALYYEEDSHMRTAERICEEMGPSAHELNQYTNAYNPIEHFDHIAEEILKECTDSDGSIKLDMVVAGVGTGGSYTGMLRKLHSRHPSCRLIAVDPFGSLLFSGDEADMRPYEVEGVGYDFFPTVLEKPDPDNFIQVNDKDSFTMARRLLREEGLLCGGSSGLNVAGAFKAIERFGLGKGSRVVVILPDSIRNYMTRHLSDSWMYSRNYLHFTKGEDYISPFESKTLIDVKASLKPMMTLSKEVPIIDAIESLHKVQQTSALVLDKCKVVSGIFDKDAYFSLLKGTVNVCDPISKVMKKTFKTVNAEDDGSLLHAGQLLADEEYVVVEDSDGPWLLRKSDIFVWTTLQHRADNHR